MRVGVLDIQGDVSEHVEALEGALSEEGLEGEVVSVKRADQMDALHGLVIPGGESTVIGGVMKDEGILTKVIENAQKRKLAVYGTCAGMILLGKKVSDSKVGETGQPLMGLMDIDVTRNVFGRQRESFETELQVPAIGDRPFRAVFIRSPWVKNLLSEEVSILARFSDKVVAVEQRNLLATAFHPELADDLRFHKYFLKKVMATRP